MFLEHRNHDKTHEPFVHVTAKAGESYVPGEALTLADGVVTKCAGTVVPTHICQHTLANAVGGEQICATLVNNMQELEAPLSAAGTSLKAGQKVTISTDGLGVTATTTDGIFLITQILGTAVGDKVRGIFMR